MGFFHEYPYTDFHEINLDWILKEIMKLHKDYDEFKAVNTITNAGAWDITKQYQAWTIVSDNNKGYISLKPVPAGVSINNTEYWGFIADYDVLITNLETRIETLETKVEKLENRFFLFIGDSYSVGTSGGVPETTFGWVDQVVSMLSIPADHYIKTTLAELGALASFWPSTASHRSWRDSIELVYTRMTDEQRAAVTDVVCCGGYNETFGGSEALTRQGMVSYIEYVKEKFPGATYWLGEIGMNTGMSAANITARNFILDTVIPTYNSAAEYGFTVMSGTDCILWNDTQNTDTIHPDAANYKLISIAIANNLLYMPAPAFNENWYGDVTLSLNAGMTFDPASPTTFRLVRMPGGTFSVSIEDYMLINITTPTLLYPVTEFPIGTYDPTYFVTGYGKVVVDVPIIMGQTDSTYSSGMASLIFQDGTVSFRSNTNTKGIATNSMQLGRFTSYIPRPLVL